MQKTKSMYIKINFVKIILVTNFLLPNNLFGQEIKISHEASHDSGRILFSLSCLNCNGSDYIKTDNIFSKAIISKEGENECVIASISIDRYISSGGADVENDVWMCLDDSLKIKFFYPVGTDSAYPFSGGISLFSVKQEGGAMGAVDYKGDVVMQPLYDFIINNSLYINGVKVIRQRGADIIFMCNIVRQKNISKEQEVKIWYDDRPPRQFSVHNEYFELADSTTFAKMMEKIEYSYDERMYLWGIHEMLNMNYEKGLFYFEKIKNISSFANLSRNIRQCKMMKR